MACIKLRGTADVNRRAEESLEADQALASSWPPWHSVTLSLLEKRVSQRMASRYGQTVADG